MTTGAEEGSEVKSVAVTTVAEAVGNGNLLKLTDEDPGEASVVGASSNGLSTGPSSSGVADAKNRVGESEGEDEENDGPQMKNTNGGFLRGCHPHGPDDEDVTLSSPIDYTNIDESPYEHNFEPGDHIIRWEMLPILWPIQVHAVVLDVSEDKSEVTICDFGITSVKTDEKDKKSNAQLEVNGKNVADENAKFNEAIQDECGDELSVSTDTSNAKKLPKKRKRLTVKKVTKWSELRKWHKVNYEGGLLNVGKGGVGKGMKNLGKKTEKWLKSMTKSFAKEEDAPHQNNIARRSVGNDIDGMDDGDQAIVRKKCPECIEEDCPAIIGEEDPQSRDSSIESASSVSNTEDEGSASQAKTVTSKETQLEEIDKSQNSKHSNIGGSHELLSEPRSVEKDECIDDYNTRSNPVKADSNEITEKPKTLVQMIVEANEIDKRSRKTESTRNQQKSWGSSLMQSLSNIFPQKSEMGVMANVDTTSEEKKTEPSLGKNGEETTDPEKQPNSNELPRADPPFLVLARTLFILKHGESILPPYHIVNSNSECIAVWCKTGRWSTLQASVFLHSTAIGNAKSTTALTLGVAAAQPLMAPIVCTLGLAAVGTPWLILKVANDKWTAATMTLTEKFWMQAEPEVFVECIEKWGQMS